MLLSDFIDLFHLRDLDRFVNLNDIKTNEIFNVSDNLDVELLRDFLLEMLYFHCAG